MAFTIREFHDFVKILEEKPEWRDELRRLVLTDELLKLPEMVRELTEAQRRTEKRLESLAAHVDNLTVRVDALAEAQRRTEERLENLTARVDALAEAQRRTEERLESLAAHVDNLTVRVDALAEKLESLTARVDALTERLENLTARVDSLTARVDSLTERLENLTARVDALAEAQRRTEERLESLAARVDALAEAQRKTEENLRALIARVDILAEAHVKLEKDVGELKGIVLEEQYRRKAGAYFGQLIRRAHTLSEDELAVLVDEGVEGGILSREEAEDLLQIDAVIRGRRWDDGAEVYLAVEVSWGVGTYDVERAVRRAESLRKLGLHTVIPVVAGRGITRDAVRLAREWNVQQVIDGRVMD